MITNSNQQIDIDKPDSATPTSNKYDGYDVIITTTINRLQNLIVSVEIIDPTTKKGFLDFSNDFIDSLFSRDKLIQSSSLSPKKNKATWQINGENSFWMVEQLAESLEFLGYRVY